MLLICMKNGIIIDESEDELSIYKYKYLQSAFSDLWPLVYIAPTMQCNYDCYYCFEKGNKGGAIMSDMIVENMVTFFKMHFHKRPISIIWFGGEPLMAFNKILEICDKLYEAEIEFTSTMITNGSLLSLEVVRKLSKLRLQYVQISMDGVAKDHNIRRKTKAGKPTFQIVIDNIGAVLKYTDLAIVIQVAVDNNNPTGFYDLREYIKEKFPDYYHSKRIQIGMNYVQDRTNFDKYNSCFNNKLITDIEIARLYEQNDIASPTLPMLSMPCMFRRKTAFAIDSQGEIYKCLEYLGNPKFSVGSLSTGKMSSRKLALSFFDNSPFSDKQCLDCNIFPICGGGCPIDRIKVKTGSLISCCHRYKAHLSEMLPHFYNNIYKNQVL